MATRTLAIGGAACRVARVARLAGLAAPTLGLRRRLYHRPARATSLVERALLTATASWGAFRDPTRADLVAIVGETTGTRALEAMRARLAGSAEGRQILAERPLMDAAAARAHRLAELPASTFGGAYHAFFVGQSLDPRPDVRFVPDGELAYVMRRYREVHDFWHVLFGLDSVSVESEAAVKWIEFMQTGLPMTLASALAAPMIGTHVSRDARARLLTRWFPWAVHAGAAAADLMCVYYERRFETPLDALRAELKIVLPPADLVAKLR